jgi:predicted RNase H-like nuclease (RuvC/YqgF family)
MFKRIWYLIFNKKEKIMSTTTKERADTSHLEDQLRNQGVQLSKLQTRISELVDEIMVMKTDIVQFRKTLSDDLIRIVEKINE